MAPVDVTPIDDLPRRNVGTTPTHGVEVLAVPGQPSVLDGGVTWPRNAAEMNGEWERLSRHARVLRDPPRPIEDMSLGDFALLGVLATARWCLGRSGMGPMSREDPLPVTGRAIRAELVFAEHAVAEQTGSYGAYATGVLTWLLWVTGRNDEPVYLGW